MKKLSRLEARIIAIAMLLSGSFAFSQAARSVATVLLEGTGAKPTLSIPMLDRNTVALAEWVRADPVALPPNSRDNPSNKKDAILPFAKLRIFVAEEATKEGEAADPLYPLQFREVADFSAGAKPAPLRMSVMLPAKDRTVWFQDPSDRKTWYSAYAIGKGANPYYKLRIVSDDKTTLVLEIDSWPAGDPTMGFGPRPK
jgi:hypothetical protein